MSTLLIGYDLLRPRQEYGPLIQRLKTMGSWWHCLDSTWLLKTTLTTVQVRDQLMGLLDPNDRLLVIDVSGRARAWVGFSEECASWLRNNV